VAAEHVVRAALFGPAGDDQDRCESLVLNLVADLGMVRRSSSTTFLMSGAVCARPTEANDETVKTAMRARAFFIHPPRHAGKRGQTPFDLRAKRGLTPFPAAVER
jgi:hypothetical protein